MSADAAITHVDAVPGDNIEWLGGDTQNSMNIASTNFNGSAAGASDGLWDLRTSGLGPNASGNTASSAGHNKDGTNVRQNGDLGTDVSGDERRRHTLVKVSGSTSYAVNIDDFASHLSPGDRVTLD